MVRKHVSETGFKQGFFFSITSQNISCRLRETRTNYLSVVVTKVKEERAVSAIKTRLLQGLPYGKMIASNYLEGSTGLYLHKW